ncbi:xanthine dehydrogenase/oxidase-like [Actinia tenebrosa]|uniref:Xanthine dehydrogenase/oxidase-like n=1 Tax=Actinia tenebrosa TaxID=6105 RepID=A0A6P8HRR6_ACTTE|nr:xanthine dehydrogenase/oxidase-like [Actinia tenebrosa]
MVSKYDHSHNKILHFTANACLTPVCSVDGMAVTTVEGIGSTKTRLHPVQERIAKSHGSQCGFCTPGIVMSMYTLLRNNPLPTQSQMESAFEGNLCRCTGYRPILEGFKTFTKEFCCGGSGNQNGCCMQQMNGLMDGDEDGDNCEALFDAKEFLPLDPTQEPIFPPELMLPQATQPRSLHIKGDHVTWIRPSTLEELLELKNTYPYAKLVVGNTELGIETKFKNQNYPILIASTHVPELNVVQQTETGVTFGSSVTLTTIEETLNDHVVHLPEFQTRTYSAILETLRWFAGQQVRNVACVGGNIITASPISDLNPIFMSIGCTLTVASIGGKQREIKFDEHFFRGYRKTCLEPNEVLISIHIPHTRQNEYMFAYKQARRRDDDIAIVNAGMRVRLEKNDVTNLLMIKECSLCYGGMAPTTVMALKTSKALIGRVWDESIVEFGCSLLEQDLPLAANAPGGQVSYRRSLTTSFFFKFYLMVTHKLSQIQSHNVTPLPEAYQSATKFHQKVSSRSIQTFQEVPADQSKDDVVGRPITHLSALKQATGEAVYVDDMPKYADELYLCLVLSQRAHAKVLSVDTSEATMMPGVHAYVCADDVPGSNHFGIAVADELVFYNEEVTSTGQVIGAIVAETQAQAQRAAKAVKIEYEDLPRILTIEEAIEAKSFFEPSMKIENGDLEKGFVQSDHVIEGEMRTGAQEHFYLETQATLAVPKGEDGEMEIFSSCQSPSTGQFLVAKSLGVPASRILMRTKRLGGGFGGKETRFSPLLAAVAVAANKVGRPVRCMLDRDEDMKNTGTRHAFLAKYKVGFKKDGSIQALDVKLYNNAGYSLDLSRAVMDRALFHSENCYRIPNIRVEGWCCKTNIPSNTAFRGFGGPQGMMIAESWIQDVAQTCGISQRQVREMNFYKEGDLTHYNQKLTGCNVSRVWNELLEKCDYEKRKHDVEQFNSVNRWKKRGIAIIPTKFGIAFSALFLNQAGALVHVYTDGSVLVTHGGTEMGQGLHTKMVQVAARALDIPISKIHLSETSTNTVPNTSPTAASASSDLNGMAVKIACDHILERLAPIKKKNPKGTWEEWINTAYFNRISLSATGFYRYPGIGYDPETNSGAPFNYFCYGAACSEVEIDCLTGDHQNLRTDIVMDVGTSLNPAIDIGQIEGGFTQGLGLFTLEEVRFSQQGALWTTGPGAYKIPGFADIPVEFSVHLLRSAPNEKAIYSSKAVGEPPLFLAASIFYAIKNAITSARRDAGIEGVFRLDSPATCERIRMACVDKFTKQFPVNTHPSVDFNVIP